MLPTDPYNFRRMSADTQASTDSSSLDQKPSTALDKSVFLPPIHTLANSEPSPPSSSLRPLSPAGSLPKGSPPSASATWHPAHQNLNTFQFPAAVDGPDSARARPQLSLDHHHHRAYPSSAAGPGPTNANANTNAGAPFAPPTTPASSTTYGNPFSPQQRISGHHNAPRVAHRPDDAYEQLMLAPGDMPSNNFSPSVAVRPANSAAPQQQPPTAPGPMGPPQPGQGPAHMMPQLAATQQRRRGKLPKPVTEFLKKWLLAHTDHPYPTEDEKKWLCSETGLSMSQVSNWMINVRLFFFFFSFLFFFFSFPFYVFLFIYSSSRSPSRRAVASSLPLQRPTLLLLLLPLQTAIARFTTVGVRSARSQARALYLVTTRLFQCTFLMRTTCRRPRVVVVDRIPPTHLQGQMGALARCLPSRHNTTCFRAQEGSSPHPRAALPARLMAISLRVHRPPVRVYIPRLVA